MIRKCDGTDPNLIMRVHQGNRVMPSVATLMKPGTDQPCDCGMEFDDVKRSVIWPHDTFLTRDDLSKLRAQFENRCMECGTFRIDGGTPMLHEASCESSGTAGHIRHMLNPDVYEDDPRYWARFTEGVEESIREKRDG